MIQSVAESIQSAERTRGGKRWEASYSSGTLAFGLIRAQNSFRKPLEGLAHGTNKAFRSLLYSALIEVCPARDHPAQEVYVTGTFDDWSKSVKLEKKAGRFEKLVELNPVDDKIDYKVSGLATNISC